MDVALRIFREIYLIIPASDASSEMSFSLVRWIKSCCSRNKLNEKKMSCYMADVY